MLPEAAAPQPARRAADYIFHLLACELALRPVGETAVETQKDYKYYRKIPIY
jgi:hypothetical protein